MSFSDKLTALRRQAGMSQEQLAERLGVTRQSVSKWESGAAQPELAKLVALSELFRVSVDYLVKDYMEEPELPAESGTSTARLEEQVEEISRYFRVWSWDSRTRIGDLPHRGDQRGSPCAGMSGFRTGGAGTGGHRAAGRWSGGPWPVVRRRRHGCGGEDRRGCRRCRGYRRWE